MTDEKDLKRLVIEEFSSENAQEMYARKAHEGLWDSERYFIEKYFVKRGRVLDLCCGTGRTTIPLFERGYKVIGIDLAPAMIASAQRIAKEKGLNIDYRVMDATRLKFPSNTFDYALFSNQGWTHIPGEKNRYKALLEAKRVLKKGGILIFTAHPRVWRGEFLSFWAKQAFRFYVQKPLIGGVEELDFGDRFFEREGTGTQFKTRQYIHIASRFEVGRLVSRAGLEMVEIDGKHQISKDDVRKYHSVFYVCRKT